MRNPWSGGFTDEAEWKFATCQRPDGSYYGHGGSKCHKGVEASLPEKAERVKKLLSMSSAEFESSYGKVRDQLMNDSCDEVVKRVTSSSPIDLSTDDLRRLESAERMSGTLERVEKFKTMGPRGEEAADKILKTKEFFDDVKWNMGAEKTLASEGSFDLAWEGINLTKNYAQESGESRSIWGQKRAGVAEHVVPTKVMKSELIKSGVTDPKGILDFAIKRNFLSITSAPEDIKFDQAKLTSSSPNPKDLMSRYKKVGIKTFMLNDSNLPKGKDHQTRITKSAAAAKEKGMTKEEWIASIVEGMENM